MLGRAGAIATIGASYDATFLREHLVDQKNDSAGSGIAELNLGGRRTTIRKRWLDGLDSRNSAGTIESLKRALLIVHSPVDRIVSIDNSGEIFRSARHPKSFISLDSAGHFLTAEADATYAGAVMGAWAQKSLADTVQEEIKHREPHDNCVVTTIGRDAYRTDILANGHSLTADEPRSLGGKNEGPKPYGLFLAGLGACTAITLRMYADRKKWPLDKVSVRLTHQKVHADDCDVEGRTGRLDLIQRDLILEGDLDQKQLEQLMAISTGCPVHRTIKNHPIIKSALIESEFAEECPE